MTGNGIRVPVLLLSGLLLTALLTRNGDIAWMSFPFLACIGFALLYTPVREDIRLEAVRSAAKTAGGRTAQVNVEVRLRNRGNAVLVLRLQDAVPEEVRLTDGSVVLKTAAAPGEEVCLRYSFEAARGVFSWKTIGVTVSDPFDFQEIGYAIPAPARILVQPAFRRFRPVKFHPWNTLASAGMIPTRTGGTGTDFAGVREYQPGDPLKALDWRMTARHPHQFFTREFVVERNAEVLLFLDGRAKTDLRIGGAALFDNMVEAAASLAEMFLHQGHRTGLFIGGGGSGAVRPDYGKIQLRRILNLLADARADGRQANPGPVPYRSVSNTTLMLVISALDTRDLPFYRELRARGYQVILISPDPFEFAKPELPLDAQGILALRTCRIERQLILKNISRLYIPVINWPVNRDLYPLIRAAFGRPLRARSR